MSWNISDWTELIKTIWRLYGTMNDMSSCKKEKGKKE